MCGIEAFGTIGMPLARDNLKAVGDDDGGGRRALTRGTGILALREQCFGRDQQSRATMKSSADPRYLLTRAYCTIRPTCRCRFSSQSWFTMGSATSMLRSDNKLPTGTMYDLPRIQCGRVNRWRSNGFAT